MTPGALTWIRAALAFAVGVGIVLMTWAAYLSGINVGWLELLLPFLASFALSFKWRPLHGGSPAARNWLVDFDSTGLLIPLVIVIGYNVGQTIVLMRDRGPPTDSVLPADYSQLLFEYITSSLKMGLLALAGSMLARLMSWAVHRVRVP